METSQGGVMSLEWQGQSLQDTAVYPLVLAHSKRGRPVEAAYFWPLPPGWAGTYLKKMRRD